MWVTCITCFWFLFFVERERDRIGDSQRDKERGTQRRRQGETQRDRVIESTKLGGSEVGRIWEESGKGKHDENTLYEFLF